MNCFRTITAVSALALSGAVSAKNFESPDDSMVGQTEVSGSAAGESESINPELPDIEMEQHEIRSVRPRAAGIGFGETIPGASLSLVSTIIINDQSAFGFLLGTGKGKKNQQIEGEYSFVNSLKSSVFGGRFVWWPSHNFPFSLDLGITGQKTSGTVTARTGYSSAIGDGHYLAYSAGVGAGLGMESFFENGFWLRWTLLHIQVARVFGGTYTNMTGAQMKSVRENFDGVKIVGVANLSVGYCW